MLGVHPGGKNFFVDEIEKKIVNIALQHNKHVIVDSTRKLEWELLLDTEDYFDTETYENVHVNTNYREFGANLTIEELIERDRARGSKTGEEVIRKWKK